MRLRLTLATCAGVAALALPAHAVVPAVDCHGVAFTDAAGDQYLGSPANTVVRPTKAIDVTRVYFTGSGLTQKVNIEVSQLTAWNNTEYTFRWNDPDNFGYYYELVGQFLGTQPTTDKSDQALLFHYAPSGSWISLNGHASVTAYHGAVVNGVEGAGVIQLGLPAQDGPSGFPSAVTGMSVRAVQYESNALTDVAVRVDTATGPASWTQPC